MKKVKLFTILFLTVITVASKAQEGGSYTYAFLDLTNSARIASLGGTAISIKDNDLSLCLVNPSLLTNKLDNQIGLSFINYFADVNYGFASYAKDIKKVGMFDVSMQYINYGKFAEADETGVAEGNFTAGEYALNIGWGRQLDSLFSIGANLKNIYSTLYPNTSYGIAVDVAGTYSNPKSQFTASLLAKNIGRQIKYYVPGDEESLPFEMQFGVAKKLAHTPFRISLDVRHLEKWDLTYSNPTDTETVDPLTGKSLKKSKLSTFLDKGMRHIVIGGELIPSKNFSIRIGYDYDIRKELGVEAKMSTVGFCWGFGIRIKQFNISYARARFHLAGSPNYITIAFNPTDFVHKNK